MCTCLCVCVCLCVSVCEYANKQRSKKEDSLLQVMNIYGDVLPSHYLRKTPVFRGFRYRVRDLCASTTEEYHLVRPVVHHIEERLHPDGGATLQYIRDLLSIFVSINIFALRKTENSIQQSGERLEEIRKKSEVRESAIHRVSLNTAKKILGATSRNMLYASLYSRFHGMFVRQDEK